ncbi:MAG: AAA family ATPase, partial [Proteobacteria bacterium]|nr:AAA family ATPase [Pseudomonadota bacterium]
MRISRVVIRNFRSFEHLDVRIAAGTTCVIGENNTGKTNFLHAIRLGIDAGLSSTYRSLAPNDIHSTVDIAHPSQVLIGLEITDFTGKINEEALVGAWQFKPGLARVIYRYRPRLSVREDLEAEELAPGDFDDLRQYEVAVLPVSDRHDRLVGRTILLTDVTERKKVE